MTAHLHTTSPHSPTKTPNSETPASYVRMLAEQKAAETRRVEQKLKDNELDRDGLMERLNESAIAAHLVGDFKGEAAILMQIAKYLGYLDEPRS